MFELPSTGFSRSIKAHNVDIGTCCDWLEASALFLQETISTADVVDVLRENEIYATQDFAWELMQDITQHLRERSRVFGRGYPLDVDQYRLRPRGPIENFAPYAFCLLLSLPASYPAWAKANGANYGEQGELFEKLTAESVEISLAGWEVHSTGWTRTNPQKLTAVVKHVAGLLGESIGAIERWSSARAKEAGLDLLCFRSFPDGRIGVPVYLVQCASGADWVDKLHTPDLRVWCKLIPFASEPKKAFSMPYALQESDFVRRTNVVDGLLLDRHRLLAPGHEAMMWVSAGLQGALTNWILPRAATLPVAAVPA